MADTSAVVRNARTGEVIAERFVDQGLTTRDRAAAISRISTTQNATVGNGTALSGAIDVRQFASGVLHMPAAWTAANIGFKVSPTNGTFLPLYDDLGVLVQVIGPAADKSYKIPDAVFAARYVQLWSQNGAGVDANQAADRVIAVDLKA